MYKDLLEEINKLTAESTEWESKYYEMQDNFHNANEEIERLNNCIDDQERVINNLIDKRDLYKINYTDYKSRCEKAVELLQKYGNGTFDEDLLNILQNGDTNGNNN